MEKKMYSVDNNQKSLVSCFISIFRKLEGSELKSEALDSVAEEVEYINSRLGLNAVQSFMVAVMLNEEAPCLLSDFAKHLHINTIEMYLYSMDMDELIDRDFVYSNYKNVHGIDKFIYSLDVNFKAAIRSNKDLDDLSASDWSVVDLMDHVDRIISARLESSIDYHFMRMKIMKYLTNTQHITFSAELLKLNLEFPELLTVLFACKSFVLYGKSFISPADYNRVYENISIQRSLFKAIKEGKNILAGKGLMESYNGENFCARLTSKAYSILLPEYEAVSESEPDLPRDGILEPEMIQAKDLFYNAHEQRQVDTLNCLLDESRFQEVQKRLSETGFRTGFACLLYGGPGTGKTETVYQLARRTGRALLPVDITDIRDKYVGETEKHIKEVFDAYRSFVDESRKKGTLCPILFFNEADAIISKRTDNVEDSVDKMENSIQNIILQEMENLDGILIATTNLTSNLDTAFERRFIYKIELSKPSAEVKSLIWRSMMPSLCANDADSLATTYDFSGGQIENVVRKQTINWVLFGKESSLDDLRTICNEECISSAKPRTRIGFCA